VFLRHPSDGLNEAFAAKPYQGVSPVDARFLFVGLDANYALDLESGPHLQPVLRYHADAVAFWRDTRVHHPFLLPGYRGAGRRYHEGFARIGFRPEHANLVSFVELLHLPTTGISKLIPRDLDKDHLRFLDVAMRSGRTKNVFVSSKVLALMRQTKMFSWIGSFAVVDGSLCVVSRNETCTVYSHLHFSYQFGRVDELRAQARAIATLIPASNA
jgi:hypothetical protein